MIKEAIKEYNRIVTDFSGDFQATSDAFVAELQKQKFTFGGRTMSNYLRPNLISVEQYNQINYYCRILREAVVRVKEAIFSVDKFVDQLGLNEQETALSAIHPGYDRLSITSRWDTFMTADAIKFVELNAETPAGIAYSDVATRIYEELPFMKEFGKTYKLTGFRTGPILLEALVNTYNQFQGRKRSSGKPNIAIVDWNDVPTWTEFELLQEYFNGQGYKTIIADPRELEYRDGILRKKDFEIDIFYKRILSNEFLERPDETKDIIDAYRDQAFCMINSFRCKLVHKKALFAVLTHEMNARYFTHEQLQVIHTVIPWTRRVRLQKTFYRNQEYDLIEFMLKNRENLVIKPNDEYGGKGITIGWLTTDAEWEAAIKAALNDRYIVQERVEIPKSSFPFMLDGNLTFADLIIDFDPYVFGPQLGGILTRLTAASLANVTSGAGSVPTFVVEKR